MQIDLQQFFARNPYSTYERVFIKPMNQDSIQFFFFKKKK